MFRAQTRPQPNKTYTQPSLPRATTIPRSVGGTELAVEPISNPAFGQPGRIGIPTRIPNTNDPLYGPQPFPTSNTINPITWTAPNLGDDLEYVAWLQGYHADKAQADADARLRRGQADIAYRNALDTLEQQGLIAGRANTTNMIERGVFGSGEQQRRETELTQSLMQQRDAADTDLASQYGAIEADRTRAVSQLESENARQAAAAKTRIASRAAQLSNAAPAPPPASPAPSTGGGGAGGGGGGGVPPSSPQAPPSAPQYNPQPTPRPIPDRIDIPAPQPAPRPIPDRVDIPAPRPMPGNTGPGTVPPPRPAPRPAPQPAPRPAPDRIDRTPPKPKPPAPITRRGPR